MKMAPVLRLLVLLACLQFVSAIRQYYMDQRCGETLNMTQLHVESAKLKLTRWHKYRNNMACYMTIEAPYNKFIMITFRDIDIKSGVFGRCEGDRLQIFDGRDSSSNMVGGLTYQLCGERRPKGAFYTTQRYLTFLFESDSFFTDDGFSLIFTSFHTGTCLSSETACKRGQCISKSLECDGYNQCGDSTDECMVKGGPIAGIIVAVCIAVAVIVVIVVCWRRRRASRGTVIKYNSPTEQATVIPPPSSYPAQPAPVPAPQAYPQAPYQQPAPQGYQQPPPQGYPQPPPQGYPQPPPQGYPPAPQPYPMGSQAYPPPQQGYPQPPSYNDATQNPYPYGAPGQTPYPPEPK